MTGLPGARGVLESLEVTNPRQLQGGAVELWLAAGEIEGGLDKCDHILEPAV